MPTPGIAPFSKVAWCGPRSLPLSDRPFVVEHCSLEEARQNGSVICVLESQSLVGGDLKAVYERFGIPVLLIVAPAELSQALAFLQPTDDVCLETAPDALIEFRVRKLLRRTAPACDALTGFLNRRGLPPR